MHCIWKQWVINFRILENCHLGCMSQKDVFKDCCRCHTERRIGGRGPAILLVWHQLYHANIISERYRLQFYGTCTAKKSQTDQCHTNWRVVRLANPSFGMTNVFLWHATHSWLMLKFRSLLHQENLNKKTQYKFTYIYLSLHIKSVRNWVSCGRAYVIAISIPQGHKRGNHMLYMPQ